MISGHARSFNDIAVSTDWLGAGCCRNDARHAISAFLPSQRRPSIVPGRKEALRSKTKKADDANALVGLIVSNHCSAQKSIFYTVITKDYYPR
jgi:hypothetical protein